MTSLYRNKKQRITTRFHLTVFFLLVSPFYLNDFASIFIQDWHLWLFIDYVGVKFLPLLMMLWLLQNRKMRLADFGLTSQSVQSFIATFLILTLIGTLIDQNGYDLIKKLPGYAALGEMPEIKSDAWNWIDLTLGLLMVGILEELVFRGYMHTFLTRYTQKPFVIVTFSALAFGLIHWSLGLYAILITSLIGAVFMIAYMRTLALPPIMLAHFMINFIDFSGLVPKSIFKLF